MKMYIKNQGYEPQSKLWKLYRSKLWGIIPSAARDCSTYQSRSAAHTELEFHNNFFAILSLIVWFSLTGLVWSETPSNPGFGLPLKCTLNENCYIMHYVDRDPQHEPVDFSCGRQTYHGHDGTDFGIADLEDMKAGIPVIAAAAGIVKRVRDGVADKLIADQTDKALVDKIECGNGVVIDHGNGWQTQYCHMRQGSIIVKPESKVDKGTILGMVGSSGLASFPHVHFTVRYQGKIVDPFVGTNNLSGCKVDLHPLWDQTISYVPTGLVRSGFASKPPVQIELWQGQFHANSSSLDDMPSLIFWVHAYGVLQGDKEHFQLTAPDGKIIIDSEKPLTKSSRSWVSYVGKRNLSEKPLIKGKWRGKYQLKRENNILIDIEREYFIQ
jgi:murein DD-endopeptidase